MVKSILNPARIVEGHVVYECLTYAGSRVFLTIHELFMDLRSRGR